MRDGGAERLRADRRAGDLSTPCRITTILGTTVGDTRRDQTFFRLVPSRLAQARHRILAIVKPLSPGNRPRKVR